MVFFFSFEPHILVYCHGLDILGDPGAVSRVDKMSVVKVYCRIERGSSRSYNIKPRTFYRPEYLPLGLRGCGWTTVWIFSLVCSSTCIHVQYCDIMRFTVPHNKHHKVSQSVRFFMHCKTVTILLSIRVRGHILMSITKNHESRYVTEQPSRPGLNSPRGCSNDLLKHLTCRLWWLPHSEGRIQCNQEKM